MVMGCHLSDKELKKLGVTRNRDGESRYTVHCDVCGEPFPCNQYNTNVVYRCPSCRDRKAQVQKQIERMLKEKIEHEEAEEIGIDHAHYQRFESAANRFGIRYYCAIEQASGVMQKFASVPEAMACIELLYIGAKVIPQKKVGRYSVDFCLPDEKLIIEVDGSLYHHDPNKDYWRDVAIKKALGDEWVIKHIPAESVMKHHELFGQSMKRLLDDRRYELNI